MRMNFLAILLPAFLLQLSTELLVAQEVRYEQNALIRIDSLSSGVILKPEASSVPGFSSLVDGNPFSYEFERPEGLLRIQEILNGCQECKLPAEDTGYTIKEIENVLRKLLAERGITIDQNIDEGADSSLSLPTTDSAPVARSVERSVDQLSGSLFYLISKQIELKRLPALAPGSGNESASSVPLYIAPIFPTVKVKIPSANSTELKGMIIAP